MSKWLTNPLESRIAFYLPSNIKGKAMPKEQRHNAIEATMEFLVKELGGGTQVEALGSFESRGNLVQEEVTICYAFLSNKALKKHTTEINRIANALCIEFEQDSLAVEVDACFYLFEPNETYRRNYEAMRAKVKRGQGQEWGYRKWLEISAKRLQ